MSDELRKETTIRKEGLSIKIRRTERGGYVWVIEADSPRLDPQEVEKIIRHTDAMLRKRFLGEEVEASEIPEPKSPEERIERTIPLESRNSRLFGRLVIYADRIALEPVKPLPVKDAAIGWLIGYLEGRFGKEKISLEHDRTDRFFRRIIVAEKPGDDGLEDLRAKAAWAFIRAITRPSGRRRRRRG
ncbi:MAG: hypothetical protein QW692_02085 [Nitrososphaerota archaeon]